MAKLTNQQRRGRVTSQVCHRIELTLPVRRAAKQLATDPSAKRGAETLEQAARPEELRRGRLRAVLAKTSAPLAHDNVLAGPRPMPLAEPEPEPAPAPNESSRDYQRRIDILERRISKLADALEGREEQLVADLRQHQETGVASRYSEVQGLAEDAANGELKRDMMAQIFSANLALQEGIASPARVAE